MIIVPVSSVTWDDSFGWPNYVDDSVSDDRIRSVLYEAELWQVEKDGRYPLVKHGDDETIIVDFHDLSDYFDSWDQTDTPEDERYHSVFDWLRDSINQGLHPVKSITFGEGVKA